MKAALIVTGKGLIWIFGSFLLGKFFVAFGWIIAAFFCSIILGIVWPIIQKDKRVSGNSVIIGLFGIIIAGLLPAILTNYFGFGSSEQNISIKNVKDHSFTTKFTFTDAHVEKDLDAYDFYGRSRVTTLYVAPIVSKEWNRTGEITAWAVSKAEGDKLWEKDCNGAVQVQNKDVIRDAIKRAVKRYKLKTSDDAMILYWTPDPDAAWREELITDTTTPIFISIIWIIVNLAGYKYKDTVPEEKKD